MAMNPEMHQENLTIAWPNPFFLQTLIQQNAKMGRHPKEMKTANIMRSAKLIF